MFNFDLKRTEIFRALRWEKFFKFISYLKKFFGILFLIFIFLFLTSGLALKFLGASLIFLVFFIIFWHLSFFFNSKLKKPQIKIPEDFGDSNLAEFLSFEVAKACLKSLKFARAKRIPEINSSILFYFLLADNPKLNFVFSRLVLDKEEIEKILKANRESTSASDRGRLPVDFSDDFQKVILESFKVAQKKGKPRIEIGDVLIALAKFNSIFQKILIQINLKDKDIENLVFWLESLEEKIEKRKRFWEFENLIKRGSLAKEWAAGYTITLDRYSTDLTEVVRKMGFPEHIGHQNEISQIERILAKTETKNCLLIGEPGLGKKAIVQGLATKSALGQSLPELNYKRIVALDLPLLLAQTLSQEEVEALLDEIFQEVVLAGNVILTIDNFHNFVGGKARPGTIDISGILAPYLQSPQFLLISVTTFKGLHENIEQNPSLLALFEKVEVSEISQRETLILLEKFALALENKYKKFISYPALKEIINLSARYLPAIPFPKKALDLLDEVMVYLSSLKEKVLLPSQVAKVISEKTQIPVGEIEIKEKEILLNLENLIHQRIINQEEAVREVSAALRRARAEVTIRKGPMGSFLFLGPTGVGKTETSKALAEVYFGSEEKMIRLDMSEFQEIRDIPRLIGEPGQEGLLTTPVRENPFSLILLDEIEKAHKNILNLFLQVLDEGHLTDGQGRKVSFKETIIIATSNAGSEIIWKEIQENKKLEIIKEELLGVLFEREIFRPEFINRFDAVVIFKPLTKENLLSISELMLQKLKQNLKEKGIEFEITLPLKEKIVELGYSPTFGAREMRRVIQDKVENILAQALLAGKLKRGDRVEIDPAEFKLQIIP